MSALAAAPSPLLSSQPQNELAATREISRVAASAARYEDGLNAIFSILLGVPGVWRVSIEAQSEFAEWLNLDGAGEPPAGQWGSAVAPLEAGVYNWGQLRMYFELDSDISTNPVRFTRYVAQQIAGILDRVALEDLRKVLRRQISALTRRLETRKAVARAISLIARRDHLSPIAALAQIRAVARRHRRSLLLTAESIIFLEGDGGNLQSPTFRRLLPTETTGSG